MSLFNNKENKKADYIFTGKCKRCGAIIHEVIRDIDKRYIDDFSNVYILDIIKHSDIHCCDDIKDSKNKILCFIDPICLEELVINNE